MAILSTKAESVRPGCLPRYATWQAAMKDSIRDPEELCRTLDLPSELAERARRAGADFPLFVPRGFAARMRPGDPSDPLLRQILPAAAETHDAAGYVADPVGDLTSRRGAGLLQKYHGRVLMVVTGACAVHCRYCFRRHFPYENTSRAPNWDEPLATIAADKTIREVILSGGDPLTLTDRPLAELASRIAAIPHVRRLRVHTRLPILIPERVTRALVNWLTGLRIATLVVVHANHARELSSDVAESLARMTGAGIPLLNQAVLLKGVNDSVTAQVELCERLVDCRVIPYYLHQLDRVSGAAHFEVPLARGKRIVADMRKLLPGYAVPRFVQEIPGKMSKTLLDESFA